MNTNKIFGKSNNMAGRLYSVSINNVRIQEGFWGWRQQINRKAAIPIEYEQCKNTGRIDAWRLNWEPGQPERPHQFWDSDVAKWIEAAAYALAVQSDSELEARVDEVVNLIESAQHDDGYLNIYYSVVEPERRWTNLKDMHELYCAGHLMEAAVAYYEATGKRKFLDVMCRYADYIDSVFGPEEGKKKGYPGHEEIELALVKLYRATGEERYLKLSRYFVDERGRQPHYFDEESMVRGENSDKHNDWNNFDGNRYAYYQAHLPVREQTTAEGHAVRAMYLYSGMVDVAAETGDETLMEACRRLWDNVVNRRMYITGGIGSNPHGERFTFDYDLPNETAYAETCAAIGLVFWAHRMLQIDEDRRYADIMERALYNGVLSGISLDGTRFFYANPLQVYPAAYKNNSLGVGGHVTPVRQKWFGCACCPPNIARILASLGQYIYSQSNKEAFINLYIQSQVDLELGGKKVVLTQKTGYPWDEKVELEVSPEEQSEFTLALRIPGWCHSFQVLINGQLIEDHGSMIDRGYLKLKRIWNSGDRVELVMEMPVEKIEAHPAIRENCGRMALQRGPIIYCLEEMDNGSNLADVLISRDEKLTSVFRDDLLGGVTVIQGKAWRRKPSDWEGILYRPLANDRSDRKEFEFTAIPYFAWCNREPGEMTVWIRCE